MKLKPSRLRNWKLNTGALVVKRQYSSWLKLMTAGLVVVTVIVIGSLIYNHGSATAGFDRLLAARRLQDLRDESRRLKDENQELRDGLARAQRQLQMDQTAYQELNKSLEKSSQDIIKLREELNFYRNIVSPEAKVAGLQIDRLVIERGKAESQYRYRLVLFQALKHESSLSGRVRMDITGMQAGQETVLSFPGPSDRAVTFNFRYFQDLEGELSLPRNFRPTRIKVSASTGGSQPAVEKAYKWPSL